MSSVPLMEIRNLSKRYGVGESILSDLTLSIHAGEAISIVGPSGCGKTTLLRCLAGLDSATAGEILHEGINQRGIPKWISVVFQDYKRSLFPWLTVGHNIALGFEDGNKRDPTRVIKINEALRSVRLEGTENHYPGQLSGGMQQRCALARSLVANPRLLILDEPFAAIDAQTRENLQDLVLRIVKSRNVATLLVTHDIDEAIYMADRVFVLSPRPTTIVKEVQVSIRWPRDQLKAKEDPVFLGIRHDIYKTMKGELERNG